MEKNLSAYGQTTYSDQSFIKLSELLNRLQVLQSEREINQSRFLCLASTTPDAIIIANAETRIVFWNIAAERMFGYTEQQANQLTIADLFDVDDQMRGLFLDKLNRHVGLTQETTVRLSDGSELMVEFSLSRWHEQHRGVYGVVLRDISERKSLEGRLAYLSHRDALTGMRNRTTFMADAETAIGHAHHVSVLLVDVDGFDDVNDKWGHRCGDEVLRTVASRLLGCLAPTCLAARLGGDKFAVLVPDRADPLQAHELATRIINAVAEPIEAHTNTIHVGASIGLAISGEASVHLPDLVGDADVALTQAKSDGGHCCRLFIPAMREKSRRQFSQEIRRAVEHQEFLLFYQPQVCLRTGFLKGAEALIRWNHPSLGILPPSMFLSSLTSGRYARPIADWVLDQACRDAARWRSMGAANFRVAVNCAKVQLRSHSLAESVFDTLNRVGLPPTGLELELTEDLILGREERDLAPLRQLRAAGIGIALDDYGTGFASLSILKDYPLTRLKIDRSFVREMNDVTDVAIIRAILGLAKSFKLDVTAEGIETENQLMRLRKQGCHDGQGFLFSKALPAQEFESQFISCGGTAWSYQGLSGY